MRSRLYVDGIMLLDSDLIKLVLRDSVEQARCSIASMTMSDPTWFFWARLCPAEVCVRLRYQVTAD